MNEETSENDWESLSLNDRFNLLLGEHYDADVVRNYIDVMNKRLGSSGGILQLEQQVVLLRFNIQDAKTEEKKEKFRSTWATHMKEYSEKEQNKE